MSLDWNISKIENLDEVCFIPAPEGEEGQRLNPVTEALIWSTLAIDIGRLTEKNVDEFAYRLFFYERLMDPFLFNQNTPRYITYEEVKNHVGLVTNVMDLSRAKWMKHMTSAIEREYGWQAERAIEKQKKELKETVSV